MQQHTDNGDNKLAHCVNQKKLFYAVDAEQFHQIEYISWNNMQNKKFRHIAIINIIKFSLEPMKSGNYCKKW